MRLSLFPRLHEVIERKCHLATLMTKGFRLLGLKFSLNWISVPCLFMRKLFSFYKCRCIFPVNLIGLVLCLIINRKVWGFFAGRTPVCMLNLCWNKYYTKCSPLSVELEMGNLSCGKITVPVNHLPLPLWGNKVNKRSTLRPYVQTGKWLKCQRKKNRFAEGVCRNIE